MHRASGYRLVRLANGVYSVHSLAERETFHPVIGPTAEAEALYVHQLGLRARLGRNTGEFVIWDVGLGAGANALTVLRATQDLPGEVRLLSFDRTVEPLRFGLAHATELGYFGGYEPAVRELIAHGRTRIAGPARRVEWQLHLADFPTLLAQPVAALLAKPHGIMFDAFSPARNPEMWTLGLFTQLFRRLDPARACALPTYSRSTMLRVSLLLAGFFVGVGRSSGEKEETTIAANTLALVAQPLDRRWLARARRSTSAEPLRQPVYRQAPLSAESWDQLLAHPQFR